MTKVIRKLVKEGFVITQEMLRGTSPYRTAHIHRYGNYVMNVGKTVPPIDYDLKILPESALS